MTSHPRLSDLLSAGHYSQQDRIFSAPMPPSAQEPERALRARVAAQHYNDYLGTVAGSHSIPVMDREVDRFLERMPRGAMVLDIGGCWGWHWRRIAAVRPDVAVLIVDFERANLHHAQQVLGSLVGNQVALMHADATALPFPDADASPHGFDGIWSVQVLQHIPDFERACREAHRVLKSGGVFATYSLHNTPLNRAVYRLFGKPFHTEGMVADVYYLARASDRQRQTIVDIFGGGVDRYTECLFHPDLKVTATGQAGSMLGRLDSYLSELPALGRWIARQRSCETRKN